MGQWQPRNIAALSLNTLARHEALDRSAYILVLEGEAFLLRPGRQHPLAVQDNAGSLPEQRLCITDTIKTSLQVSSTDEALA